MTEHEVFLSQLGLDDVAKITSENKHNNDCGTKSYYKLMLKVNWWQYNKFIDVQNVALFSVFIIPFQLVAA